ncbi:MAG: DUF342 domain-containing protein [Lachnospiraceae bacterium]|nr:DUF342 domain-containing protein [Lachnospiraceae bacterium]
MANEFVHELETDTEFDWFQMEEIKKGQAHGIDISLYARPEIPYDKMCQLREGYEEGIDLAPYLDYPARILKQIRLAMSSGIDLIPYAKKGYDAEQLEQIRLAIQHKVSLDPYLSMNFRGVALHEIRKGLQAGLDVTQYISPDYDWARMRELRLGLQRQLDITQYNNPFYSWQQMHEIRLGLEQGLDVSEYRKLRYSAAEMRRKRLRLLKIADNSLDIIQEDEYKFSFSSGSMEAYLFFSGDTKDLTIDILMELLEQNSIRYGIRKEGLEEILNQKSPSSVLVAQGLPPTMGPNGWYEYFFRTQLDRTPKLNKDGTVDYSEVDWFETVKNGQKIAFYHDAEPGIDGYSVTGDVIKARKGIEQSVLTGTGFYMADDKKTYYSMLDGKIQLQGNTITITNYMEIKDNVTVATGNIRFNGNVSIKGDVSDGVIIDVGGDLSISGTVNAAKITCGGSVLFKSGMNANGQGFVKAKGNVESRFFEAVRVESDKDIKVNRCLNSQLYAKGMIISSKVIAGGTAEATNGFQLRDVGNDTGLHTVLKIATNPVLLQHLYKVNESRRELEDELLTLAHALKEIQEKFTPEIYSTMEMYIKIEKAIFLKKKQLTELEGIWDRINKEIQKAYKARVVITGTAYEGTVVNVNEKRWHADNRRNVVIATVNNDLSIGNNR